MGRLWTVSEQAVIRRVGGLQRKHAFPVILKPGSTLSEAAESHPGVLKGMVRLINKLKDILKLMNRESMAETSQCKPTSHASALKNE